MQCVLKGYATCSSLGKIVLVRFFGMILLVFLAVLHSHRGRQGHLRESSHSSARDIDDKEIWVLY